MVVYYYARYTRVVVYRLDKGINDQIITFLEKPSTAPKTTMLYLLKKKKNFKKILPTFIYTIY